MASLYKPGECVFPLTYIMAKRAKKIKFNSNTKILTLINKVQLNQKLLIASLSAEGITNKRTLAAWEKVTDAVHLVECQKMV